MKLQIILNYVFFLTPPHFALLRTIFLQIIFENVAYNEIFISRKQIVKN